MRDLHFSYGMLIAMAAGLALYGVRAALYGRARHDRVTKDGGSIFVGMRFMEFGYWLMEPVVGLLYRLGVTANAVTASSVVPALGAGVAVAQGWFGLACVLATAAGLSDIIDGLLARRHGSGSDAGEVLDAMVDRYGEFFFLAGLIVHYRSSLFLCVTAVLALQGAFMISYSTAKAESLGVPPPRGSMRRAERTIYLLFGAGLTPFAGLLVGSAAPLPLREAPMILTMGLVAVVSNASAIVRSRAMIRLVQERDAREAARRAPPVAGAILAGVPDAVPDQSRSSG